MAKHSICTTKNKHISNAFLLKNDNSYNKITHIFFKKDTENNCVEGFINEFDGNIVTKMNIKNNGHKNNALQNITPFFPS